MGHLVNPIAWRLGKNIYWRSLYYINGLDFASNNINDINLFIFLNKFFKKKLLNFSGLGISNFKILRFFYGTFVYILFKSYNYNTSGIFKYSKSTALGRFIGKKLFKRKSTYYTKKIRKKNYMAVKDDQFAKTKKYRYVPYKSKHENEDIDRLRDDRIDVFKKIVRKDSKFIARKVSFFKMRYKARLRFVNYFSYIDDFKNNFEHMLNREKEFYKVSFVLKKLKKFFLFKFSKKKRRKNNIFHTYFFRKPLIYFRKKLSNIFKPAENVFKRLFSDNSAFDNYNFKGFFIFNFLKLFPKIYMNLSDKYTSLYKKYVFIKNRFDFKMGFYNNFLHIYRKFPIFLFIKNFLSSFVNKFFSRTKFIFIFCSEKFISANLIKDFILSKMSYKFKLGRITFVILRLLGDLRKKKLIKGYRILLAGRFSRKDRATFYWKKRGLLSLNNKMSALDYSFGTKVLRYSLCVCKVWINN